MITLNNHMTPRSDNRHEICSAFHPVSKPIKHLVDDPSSYKSEGKTPVSIKCAFPRSAEAINTAGMHSQISQSGDSKRSDQDVVKSAFVPMRPWEDNEMKTTNTKPRDKIPENKFTTSFANNSPHAYPAHVPYAKSTYSIPFHHNVPMIHQPAPVHLSMNILSPAALSLSLSSVHNTSAPWPHHNIPVQENPFIMHSTSTYPYINIA